MRRLVALFALLLAGWPAVHAQTGGGQAEGHGGHAPGPPAFTPLTVDDISPIERRPLRIIGDVVPVPPSAAPDVMGAFRLVCNMSHLSHDDPIVYPGQPGKAHLHHFFGNTGANAFSTYRSLRTTGEGTCQGAELNRSAYWMPALLTEAEGGRVVVPDYVGLYYKRRPDGDPACATEAERCGGIPAGMRAIFGTNYVLDERQSRNVVFDCNAGFTAPTLADLAERCAGAKHIYARVAAPACWDGVNLDSRDHQSHLAYQVRNRNSGRPRCPGTHPVLIPTLTLTAAYAILPGDTPQSWIFSSDVVAGAEAGATFHADYMEAWEPQARLAWEANCIGRMLNCSGGDLGNGIRMKAPAGYTLAQRPHLVKVPD